MPLRDAVLDLAATFGREGLDHGSLTVRDDAPAPGSSTDALEELLESIEVGDGVTIGGLLNLRLAPRDVLPRLQDGRAWVSVHDERRRDTTWPMTWVVFAQVGDDAVVVDTADPRCPVRGCAGSTYLPLADGLEDYLRAVAAVMRVEVEHGSDALDVDVAIEPVDPADTQERDDLDADPDEQDADGVRPPSDPDLDTELLARARAAVEAVVGRDCVDGFTEFHLR